MNQRSTTESLPLEYVRLSYMHAFKDFHSWKFVFENKVVLSRDGTFCRELVPCGFPLVVCILNQYFHSTCDGTCPEVVFKFE